LDFYTDLMAKSGSVANALAFATNYATDFDVVLPEAVDFSERQ
jgi:hypothetical protein